MQYTSQIKSEKYCKNNKLNKKYVVENYPFFWKEKPAIVYQVQKAEKYSTKANL